MVTLSEADSEAVAAPRPGPEDWGCFELATDAIYGAVRMYGCIYGLRIAMYAAVCCMAIHTARERVRCMGP